MSFLKAFGGDIKKIFAWAGSPKVQAVIATVETGVEDAFPAATGVITTINTWTTEIFKSEAMAEAAAAAPGVTTNGQKEAAVLSVMTPQIISIFAANKLPIPNATQIAAANASLVTVLNILSGATPTKAETPAASTPAPPNAG